MKKIILVFLSIVSMASIFAGTAVVNNPIGLSTPAFVSSTSSGGSSTVVNATSPIVSSEISGGYNISCPTCLSSLTGIVFTSPNTTYQANMLLNNDGDLVVNSIGASEIGALRYPGNVIITGAFAAERGGVFDDDVAMRNGKSLGFFGPGGFNLSTLRVSSSGNFSFNAPGKFEFNNALDLTNHNIDNAAWVTASNFNTQGVMTWNESGVRAFTATASGGNLLIASNDGLGDISATSHKISNLADPASPQDAMNLNYASNNFYKNNLPLNQITAATDDVSLNYKKIKDLANGVASTDAATVGQLPVVSALNQVYYVSKTGSDSTGSGSQSLPYATVNKVLSLIPSNNSNHVTIYVAPGVYTENIIVTKQKIDLVGMEAPSTQPKAVIFPSLSITTVGSNSGNYVDNGVSVSNLTFSARSGLETFAISYTGSNLFLSLNDVLIGNDSNIDGIVMNVADSSRLYVNNSSINVSGTAIGMNFSRGELWDFRNSACTSGNADCIVSNSNNVAIYSAVNSTFTSNLHVFKFTNSNNKGVIATFSQCLIQGAPTGTLTTDAMVQLGSSFSISFNNSSLVNAGGNAQVGNAVVYLGPSSVLLLTYSSISTTATNNSLFVPFKSQTANNSIFQYYGNVFLSSGANVYSKPASGVGGFLVVSKMQTDS